MRPLDQASDATTGADTLASLASHEEEAVQAAVARHPNTPVEVLWRLAVSYPEAVWQNPVLDLLALESPRWIDDVPARATGALFAHPTAPERWLRWGAQKARMVRRAVAGNPCAPAEVLRQLAGDKHRLVRNRVLENPALPQDVLLAQLRRASIPGDDNGGRARSALLGHAKVPEGLRRLLWKGGMGLEENIFGEEAQPLSAEERQELVAFGTLGRAVVAAHPWTPAEALRDLASDPEARVRRALAGNPWAPPDVIGRLVKDPDYEVGRVAARNYQLPPAERALVRRAAYVATINDPAEPLTAEERAELERWGAFGALLRAGDPGCPPDTLEELAGSSVEAIWQTLCANPNTPDPVIEWLVQEYREKVISFVALNPRLPTDVLLRCDDSLLATAVIILSEREDLSTPLAVRLAGSNAPYFGADDAGMLFESLYPARLPAPQSCTRANAEMVQAGLATHPALPPDDARDFVRNFMPAAAPFPSVVVSVAQAREGLPATVPMSPQLEVLLRLLGSGSEEHRKAAITHDALPSWISDLLRDAGMTADGTDVQGPAGELSRQERDFLRALGPFGKELVAAHPLTTAEELRQLGKTASELVLERVAKHWATPMEVLLRLLNRDDYQIAVAAVHNPSFPEDLRQLLRYAGWGEFGDATPPQGPLTAAQREQLRATGPIGLSLIARNPHTAPKVLRQLAEERRDLLWVIAANPQTPEDILTVLAEEGHYAGPTPQAPNCSRAGAPPSSPRERRRIREAALSNPHTPSCVLRKQAESNDHRAPRAIAANPSTPQDVLERLATASDRDVRRVASSNTQLPVETLRLLRRAGASEELTDMGQPAPDLSADECARLLALGPFAQALVADHPHARRVDRAPPGAEDTEYERDAEFKRLLNPHISPDELARRAYRATHDELSLMARNPRTPPYVLTALLGSGYASVRRAAAAHPNAPADILLLLRKAGADKKLAYPFDWDAVGDPETLTVDEQKALCHLGVYGRQLLAYHPEVHEDILCLLSESGLFRSKVTSQLVEREDLPVAALERLVVDPHAFKARERLANHPDADPLFFLLD